MTQSKQYTFNHLFGEVFSYKDDNDELQEVTLQRIIIPIIQRDYAQGRRNAEVDRIRKRFIRSLYDGLMNNQPNVLDFVYGDITDKGDMIPLDGQQRLTTLFLLHWYVAKHENVSMEQCNFLHKFSYETRVSARQFFDSLADYTDIDFDTETLSDGIRNQYWFPYDWEKDPTIMSALTMLDEIHTTFKVTQGIWQKLESGLIAFYFLSVKDMGLTDDLYIKMNSRGKPLTEFEHFKASLEAALNKLDTNLASRIIKKIDLEWTDMLWPYRGDNNIIDDEFMRYFSFISTLLYYKQGETNFSVNPFDLIEQLYGDSKENVGYFEGMFDIWCSIGDINTFFNEIYTKGQYQEGKICLFFPLQDGNVNIFLDCCNDFGIMYGRGIRRFPWPKFLTLYAITEYLRNQETVSRDEAQIRLRSINNLINSSEFEMREDRMQAILQQISNIVVSGDYSSVAQSLNEGQVDEERLKHEKLQQQPELRALVNKLEDHPLLQGTISIVGFENIEKVNKFYDLFNGAEQRNSLIGRAMLTMADYSQKLSWRYQIGTKMDATWKEMFHTPSRQGFSKTKETLNQLLDMYESFSDDELRSMIDSYINSASEFDWRYYLLKYYDCIPERYGMFYWPDHRNTGNTKYDFISMYTEKSIGGRNWYVILLILYKLGGEVLSGLTLADYAYNGDGVYLGVIAGNKTYHLTMTEAGYEVTLDDKAVNEFCASFKQNEGKLDVEDRVVLGQHLIEMIKKNA